MQRGKGGHAAQSRFPTRRDILKTSAGVAGTFASTLVVPRWVYATNAQVAARWESAPRWASVPAIDDPRLKVLLLRGLDAATSAGAEYADVRLTRTLHRSVTPEGTGDGEEFHVGIRALRKGYWGFTASPVMTDEELLRLGREAAFQAQTNALGKVRDMEFAPVPTVSNGQWVMPVKIDPLSIHPLAIQDYLAGLRTQINSEAELGRDENLTVDIGAEFMVQERALATTQGTYVTQCVYRTSGRVVVGVVRGNNWRQPEVRSVETITPSGVGWELFRDQPILEAALQLVLDVRADLDVPKKPIDPGKFTTILDASGVAGLVSESIGAASELDRALGHGANADGTSYLSDPRTMLDSFVVGSPLLTVIANRSEPGGVATVQWDDEGVTPTPFTVVENGIFRNYHYTREGAGWLRAGGVTRPFRSLGVAVAPLGVDAPSPHTANLVLTPGNGRANFQSFIENTEKGIAIQNGGARMDFQRGSGVFLGRMYEINKGKRVARLINGGILFHTTRLWKALFALGDAGSARRFGRLAFKGEPTQSSFHSVTAVPAAFRDVTVVDMQRG